MEPPYEIEGMGQVVEEIEAKSCRVVFDAKHEYKFAKATLQTASGRRVITNVQACDKWLPDGEVYGEWAKAHPDKPYPSETWYLFLAPEGVPLAEDDMSCPVILVKTKDFKESWINDRRINEDGHDEEDEDEDED